MDARIRNDTLEMDYRRLLQRHLELKELARSRPKPEWQSTAKQLQHELTDLLRRIQTARPGTSAERLLITEANGKVLSALSSIGAMLK
ncbi:MAG: hypothetical protein V2A62_02735 [Candidatus Woesearchaeota archaeon]